MCYIICCTGTTIHERSLSLYSAGITHFLPGLPGLRKTTMPEQPYDMDSISLHFRSMAFPFVLLLVAAAAVFAWWYYRDTVPAVTGWTKRAVLGLRIAALAVLVFGFAEPVAHVVATITNRDITAVLIDTSSSMDDPGDTGRKREALDVLSEFRSRLAENGAYFTFDSGVRPLGSGEPSFAGTATDIGRAIHEAASVENVRSILLVSDGCWNLGENPAGVAAPEGVTIHTVVTGSPAGSAEVVLASVSASPVGHEGARLPVEIAVSSAFPGTGPVPVEILENGRTVASGVAAPEGGNQALITLEVPLESPGGKRFTAVVRPVEDGIEANNTRSFDVQVLKSSFRILLAAAAPSADLAFLRRTIESDPAFDLEVAIGGIAPEENRNAFRDGAFDAAIVLDGGGDPLTPAAASRVIESVSGGSGLWVLGSSLAGSGVGVIAGALPVTFQQGRSPAETDIFIRPTESGTTHFITSGIQQPGLGGGWDLLPPLSSILLSANVVSSARVLAEAFSDLPGWKPLPAIITGRYGAGKVLVMPVSGIWRWRLLAAGAGREETFFRSFVLGTLRWLTSDTETSPLTVSTGRQSYLSGQEIVFEGRLFDKVYMPVSGAAISLVVDGDPSLKVFLRETSPAVYRGTIGGIDPGEHTFSASAYLKDTLFAESAGSFTVERFSLEMLDTTSRPGLLGAIATRSGGVSVTAAGIDSLFQSLVHEARTERRERDSHLYLHPLLPILVVAFLAAEWTIRKRRGLL